MEGIPPQFLPEQESLQSVVVSSDVFITMGNERANLVLPCSVTGTMPISVTWYMEGILISQEHVRDNSTLILNVTENFGAARDGVTYYCIASNLIGPEDSKYTAALRSRDINVTYTCKMVLVV